jgi:hypothetical protein
MEKQSVVITEVEDFIKRWTSGELIFTPETRNMTITYETGKNFLGMTKKRTVNLPNEIGDAVATYQLQKDLGNPRTRLERAYEVLALIQKVRAFNRIRDAKQQARESEQEIEQLKERVNSLVRLNNELVLENKRLHNLVPNRTKSKGDTEVGDVSG